MSDKPNHNIVLTDSILLTSIKDRISYYNSRMSEKVHFSDSVDLDLMLRFMFIPQFVIDIYIDISRNEEPIIEVEEFILRIYKDILGSPFICEKFIKEELETSVAFTGVCRGFFLGMNNVADKKYDEETRTFLKSRLAHVVDEINEALEDLETGDKEKMMEELIDAKLVLTGTFLHLGLSKENIEKLSNDKMRYNLLGRMKLA